MKANSDSFSVGYFKKDSYFNTKEFIVYELKEMDNYLFDPLNVFLVMKKFQSIYQWKNSFFTKLHEDFQYKNDYQSIFDTYLSKLNKHGAKIKINLVKTKGEMLALNYSQSIFESKLIKDIHCVFCEIESCMLYINDLKEECFF